MYTSAYLSINFDTFMFISQHILIGLHWISGRIGYPAGFGTFRRDPIRSGYLTDPAGYCYFSGRSRAYIWTMELLFSIIMIVFIIIVHTDANFMQSP